MTVVAERKVETRVQILLEERNRSSPKLASSKSSSPNLEVSKELASVVAKFFLDWCPRSDVVILTTTVLQALYESEEADTDACFREAVHATALRSKANQFGLDDMIVEAERAYGRALAATNLILKDSPNITKDTTLATLYLLGLYEVCTVYRRISSFKSRPS
jgi:hypothetical protein